MGPSLPSLGTLRVLRAMLDDPEGEHYGAELSAITALKSGALYPILGRLESEGWITGRWEEIDESTAKRRRRRYYSLTRAGGLIARALLEQVTSMLEPPPRKPPQHRDSALGG